MSYKTEFPDFPASHMPRIPLGFDDVSWHNDAMPRFESEALGLTLWIDYLQPEKREIETGRRFLLVHNGHDSADVELIETNSMDEINAEITAHCAREYGHTDTGRGICAHCGMDMT